MLNNVTYCCYLYIQDCRHGNRFLWATKECARLIATIDSVRALRTLGSAQALAI